ncbi:nuclear transport factor 2 family protein [Piscinibacter sp. HJYY11]|uniref:nuclear transport factor 2 family protein n=1 Tax=Piscinibacter sp. HJYY11 TaxID=2801333 RepID=UPI00191F735A|nr:nuclear transport factor 2 family protein [Piscinibacter sp. HJYY11]MBL0727159.1 nuclear transport factor 2 family protein [Piscinibacter sp. HJYY11]
MKALEIVRELFVAIENSDLARLDELYAAHAVQVEHPNRLLPGGATRNKSEILQAAARGRALMAEQKLAIEQAVVQESHVAVEARWSGRLSVDAPPLGLKAGSLMTARFAQFIELDGGRVVRHVTYDCFDAW